MKIAIDAHTIGKEAAGHETYIKNTIASLAEIDRENRYTLYLSDRDVIETYRGRWPNFEVRHIDLTTPIVRKFLSFAARLRMHPADIFFAQAYVPRYCPCKSVTMIADLSFEHFPEAFNSEDRTRMKSTVLRSAQTASHITTLSEHSRKDLIELYGIEPERVTTTLLAAASIFRPIKDEDELQRVREKYDLPDQFILGVGTVEPRKNLVRLIEAYSILRKRNSNTPALILVGKNGWLTDESLNAAVKFGVEEYVKFTGYVAEEDLPVLYSAAVFFVYPSYFEGFGLPPLEAMQCGTPVITGDLTSLPEVVGDAGIMVDPLDVNAIADAMERLLSDSELRFTLSNKGIERAARFTWSNVAKQTLQIFERVATAK
jgi:glycosyltransferase involved in cell wall biosynthesis